MAQPLTKRERDLYDYCVERLIALRVVRYSWWTHWRELADYFLPRRYKWIITPNQMSRGSPINQNILDSSGVIAARNLASGLLSGKSSPLRRWFKLRIGKLDSTQTSPVSLWLAECERLLYLIFQESNFYNAIATFYFDLIIFGTAALIEYEDYDNVVNFIGPCAGEYYVDIDGNYRPCILYREFTMTIAAVVDLFGIDNVSSNVRRVYEEEHGANRSREIIIAHAIQPNTDGYFPKHFAYGEVYWEWGGSAAAQASATAPPGFLRKRGFYEKPCIIGRWDLVSNDPYGRSPAMDALGDQKQLQQETKRKAQSIDKMTNPPMVADIQLQNKPASLLPGGMTYVTNYAATGKPGFSSVYDTKFPVAEIKDDLAEVRDRIRKIFFNDLFQTASQFETRSNVTAVEWDMRKSESMIMLGPALERIDHEVLSAVIERTFAIAHRAGVIPPSPPEVAGLGMDIEFVSMLAQAQEAAQAASIERVLGLAGNLAGVDPAVMDNIDIDYSLDKYSSLLGNDPKMIRSPEQLEAIRQNRQRQQQAAQQAQMAEQLAKGAKTLSETDVGGKNALEGMLGV